jgi:hypothetical protein
MLDDLALRCLLNEHVRSRRWQAHKRTSRNEYLQRRWAHRLETIDQSAGASIDPQPAAVDSAGAAA